MSKLKQVLQSYGMFPYQGEMITKKLAKVYTGNQYVALKQTKTPHVNRTFAMVYQLAKKKNLSSVAQVYLNDKQSPVLLGKKHSYYVSPWFKSKQDVSFSSSLLPFFSELAVIHTKTAVDRRLNVDQVQDWIQAQKSKVKTNFNQFEKWIGSFEANHYMSPSELLICHSYRLIREISMQMEYWYGEWLERVREEKKMTFSLCHGNLSPSHFINSVDGMVLINWEKAFYGHPAKDLAQFFYSICFYHDAPIEQLIEGLNIYVDQHTFMNGDISILSLHLLNLDRYLQEVYQYVKNPNLRTEVEWIQRFQRYQFYFDHVLKVQKHLQDEHINNDDESI
ncbi:protein kinase family protein [Salinibacillus xinjiangensis]|uniref:Phosphotransferase n=1 Tax=Salinibacillus xinjiangensis TaxID=1229268 RepID=A0A6G1XBA3_9BACI|nr:hypothetical protein [Salinibacillus xinjiangensis]MRG88212.1 hypothetical protein [Salinibacillus xinjiangensis]